MSNKLDKGNFSLSYIVSSFWSYKYIYTLILIFSLIIVYIATISYSKYTGKASYKVSLKDVRGFENKSEDTIFSMSNNFKQFITFKDFKNCKFKDNFTFERQIYPIVSHQGYNLNIFFKEFHNKKILEMCIKDVDEIIRKLFKEAKILEITEDEYHYSKHKNNLKLLTSAYASEQLKTESYIAAYISYSEKKDQLAESKSLTIEYLEDFIYVNRMLLKKSDILGISILLSIIFFMFFLFMRIFIDYLNELKKINK